MSTNIKIPIVDLTSVAAGQRGCDWIDDTTAHVGDWGVLMALTDAAFTTLVTDENTKSSVNGVAANLDGKTLAQGLFIFGRFTTITLASGSVLAYRV